MRGAIPNLSADYDDECEDIANEEEEFDSPELCDAKESIGFDRFIVSKEDD